jgi:hypothetical protein
MIESALLKHFKKRFRVETTRDNILHILSARLGHVPEDVSARLRSIKSARKLQALLLQAAVCTDLDAFQAAMRS